MYNSGIEPHTIYSRLMHWSGLSLSGRLQRKVHALTRPASHSHFDASQVDVGEAYRLPAIDVQLIRIA